MGNIRVLASSLFALTTLVACGDDGGAITIVDSGIVDAPPIDSAPPIDQPPPIEYDFSCFGNQPGTVAKAVTISGTAQEVYLAGTAPGIRAVADAAIKVCTGDCEGDNELAALDPTGATGVFTTDAIPTAGAALPLYLSATRTGDLPTLLFPHTDVTSDVSDVPLLLVQSSLLQFLTFIGITQDPANGVVVVAVTDCSAGLQGVTGAVVEVTQGGNPVGDDPLDAGAFDPMGAGVYLITNMPPGATLVTATMGTQGFLDNDVTVAAGTVTAAQVRPGY